MSQTVAVLERTQEFVNSLLFSATAAHSRAATHPGPHESCVTGNHVRVQPDAITTSMEHKLAGATDWRVGFPCRTSRMPSRMSGWLLLSKTAVSELGERLWEDYLAFARRDLSEYETGIRAVERWRSVKLTEFERRQLAAIPRLNEDPRSCWLTPGARWIRVWLMIRPGFLSAAERGALIAVARDGLVEHRVARRANAIVLLNDGWNCEEVGSALLLDDDTVREWFEVYQRQGMAGLRNFGHEGSSCQLTDEQQTALKAFVTTRLPRSTNAIGAWLRKNYELSYSHSGLIALLHRLDFVYHKPQRVPRKLDEAQQQAFIASYEKLLNLLETDESVVFVDAAHPTHQARPTGCWAPKDVAIGIEQTTGRQRLNIHGAINLETGQTQMLEAPKIDAMSLIALLVAIEATYSGKKWIYVFLDNATYHHAILVREWLGQPGRRIRLHFIPSYCPHLDPIERCWGVMHEHVTNNRSYETFAQFRSAILRFLRRTVPKKWDRFRDRITDNFRIISPDDFRVVA